MRESSVRPVSGAVGESRTHQPEGVKALDLQELLLLKLMAFRDIDRVHIRDMLKVGLLDETLINQTPATSAAAGRDPRES